MILSALVFACPERHAPAWFAVENLHASALPSCHGLAPCLDLILPFLRARADSYMTAWLQP